MGRHFCPDGACSLSHGVPLSVFWRHSAIRLFRLDWIQVSFCAGVVVLHNLQYSRPAASHWTRNRAFPIPSRELSSFDFRQVLARSPSSQLSFVNLLLV